MNTKNQPIPSDQSQRLVADELVNATIDENTQKMINDPQPDPKGANQKDQEFLKLVMELINNETIDLHKPSTLMNKDVYNNISEEAQGIADINAVTLLGDLRQIKLLVAMDKKDTFQIQNLIHRIRLTKERLEKQCGDVYII